MASTPPGFVDLNSALKRSKSESNIIGVVIDFMAPGRSRGTDWMSSFSITDSSYSTLHDGGFKVRFFRPMESELPAITGIGDVILLRGIKINEWSGMTIGLSTRTTSWVVFPAASIPATVPVSGLQLNNVKEPRAPAPSIAEMRYAVSLCNSQDRSALIESVALPAGTSMAPLQNITSSAGMPKRDKFSLIKDIKVETYYDLVGQIVKVYPHNNRVELYMTDYTSNSLLFNYEWGQDDVDGSGREGDVYNYAPRQSTMGKWPGPPGYRTLTVTLWPPHSYFAQQTLKEKDFVYLRNVHMKWSKDSKIEGVLHSDRLYPDRIDITVLDPNERDDRVKDVLRRKRDLAKQFPAQRDEFIAQARAQKRKEIEGDKPLSKTAAKKKRRLEKERLENNKSGETGDLDDKENSASGTGLASKARAGRDPPLVDPPSVYPNKHDLNKNVHCGHHLITPRSLSSILSLDAYTNTTPNGTSYNLPFQNINSRALVRIIDFFPSELADFAVPCAKPSEYDILSEPEESEDGGGSEISSESNTIEPVTERRWEWRFGFILEDALGPKNQAKTTMEVYVVGEDAECLLKLDAENLRKSPTALAKLREKLFLLWGDLEEWKARKSLTLRQVDGNSRSPKKEETPKGRPFQCCIKEYGVKKRLKQTIEDVDGDSGNDGDSEDDSQGKQDCTRARRSWTWERRWRMFGCTII